MKHNLGKKKNLLIRVNSFYRLHTFLKSEKCLEFYKDVSILCSNVKV